jgi:hypothetical protein
VWLEGSRGGGNLIERLLLFWDKSATQWGLDTFECIRRGRWVEDAFEGRPSSLCGRFHYLLFTGLSGSESNLRENVKHYFVPRGQKQVIILLSLEQKRAERDQGFCASCTTS